MTQNILITGGTGFVGSHLVETLLGAGETNIHVTAFSTRSNFVSTLLPANHIHALDLSDQAATQKLLSELHPTQIYHLAAYAAVGNSFGRGQEVLEHNVKLQNSFLEAVRQSAPQARVLVVGSGMEYDFLVPPIAAETTESGQTQISETHPLGPVSPYALSKVLQDLLALSYAYSYNLDIVRARPFNHIGERQTTDFAVPSFVEQIVAIERGEQSELRVGNLSAVRDFLDVKDVCAAYILLMAQGKTRDVYNIGSGQGHTMQEIVDWLVAHATTPIKIVNDPSKVRPLDVPAVIADSRKVRALGWAPQIQLETTLGRILEEWQHKKD